MLKSIKQKVALLKTSFQELTKVKQYVVFLGTSGLVLAVVATGLGMKVFGATSSKPNKQLETTPKQKKIKIESSGSSLDQQEVWIDRLEKERNLLIKRVDELEKLVKPLAQEKLSRVAGASHRSPEATLLATSSNSPQSLNPDFLESKTERDGNTSQSPETGDKGFSSSEDKPKEKAKFHRISFKLDPQFSKKIKRSTDHYVPAGSFVRGVLTSGVVASTSVQASANPQPVHIQLTHLGNLPRGFKTDVKQCFLIGSAYGDLPSERVYMRLEKLSCVERKTQEVIELSVDGYVAGEDGANGLRGTVVDRSGPAMRNAFVGGFFAGMGDFFGQQKSQVPTAISQSGVAMVNPLSAQHLLQSGVGKGIGNATEKFSDFYIKRAEQLQPVVEIEAGRKIDVVFKSGFDMNQTVYRQTLMNTHDAERRDVAAQVDDRRVNDQRIDEHNLQTMKGVTQ